MRSEKARTRPERSTQRKLTRRAAILAGGAGLGMIGYAARTPRVWRLAGPVYARAAGGPLQEPDVRLSTNGVLETTLEARNDPRVISGGMTYDGQLPGPVLRLRPGDLLKIGLTN